MSIHTLRANGVLHRVEAPEDMTLLWILRDLLGLTGTRYGCGVGVCGACTLHVDGVATRACTLPMGELGNRSITTIEGLGAENLHPVQRAWLDADVAQCGYCQPGMIMTTAALYDAQPRPACPVVTKALSDQVCRCGTYPAMRRALGKLFPVGPH